MIWYLETKEINYKITNILPPKMMKRDKTNNSRNWANGQRSSFLCPNFIPKDQEESSLPFLKSFTANEQELLRKEAMKSKDFETIKYKYESEDKNISPWAYIMKFILNWDISQVK